MAAKETGKQRAIRIPLDYFKRPDWLEQWKLWLSGGVLVLAGLWLLAGIVWSSQGRLQYSRGPVAAVHAAWEANCEACHTPFAPMSGENWMQRRAGDSHAGDQQCKTCHAGPPHHATQVAEETPTCAACHRDHQGRDFSLVHTPDSECTRCHGSLAAHTQGNQTAYQDVRRFADVEHPEFKIFREGAHDPGMLKFNHKLHMTAGLVLEPGSKPWRLADITDEAERKRYRQGQDRDETAVKLECASCHVTDSGDFRLPRQQTGTLPASLLSGRTSGADMVPITYENQCKACHPLTFDPKMPARAVPHRLQPDRVKDFLQGTYAAQYLSEHPELLERPLPRRPLPGKASKVGGAEEEKARKAIDDKVLQAERILYSGKKTCGECHHYEEPGLASPKRIVPAVIPDVWFIHARFNHAAHRAVSCQLCHPQAYPDAPNASTASTDVMLPQIENCLQCHGPRQSSGGNLTGGARSDCVECHRYHHGDAPLQGIGARAREPQNKLQSIQDFLSGGVSKK